MNHQLMTDDNNIIKPYIVESHVENIVNNSSNNNENLLDTSSISILSDEFTEMLIESVSKRSCLWNYKLPIQQRIQSKREAAWQEISEDLEGKWSTDTIKLRWKNLRDSY